MQQDRQQQKNDDNFFRRRFFRPFLFQWELRFILFLFQWDYSLAFAFCVEDYAIVPKKEKTTRNMFFFLVVYSEVPSNVERITFRDYVTKLKYNDFVVAASVRLVERLHGTLNAIKMTKLYTITHTHTHTRARIVRDERARLNSIFGKSISPMRLWYALYAMTAAKRLCKYRVPRSCIAVYTLGWFFV